MCAWSGQICFQTPVEKKKKQIHLKRSAVNLQACYCTHKMHTLAVSCRKTATKRDLFLPWPHCGFVSWAEDPKCSFLCYYKDLGCCA